MALLRIFKWLAGLLAVAILFAVLLIAAFGWNWLREPIIRLAEERTGRELVIAGDLHIGVHWPSLEVSAGQVRFGNPPWASRKNMLEAAAIDLAINLPALLGGHLRLDAATLHEGDLALEVGPKGEKNWLLDRSQKEEQSRLDIARLILDKSRIAFDDPHLKTSFVAEISSRNASAENALDLRAKGHFRGLPVSIEGSGGPILALRDPTQPYPFQLAGKVGATKASAEGTVTGVRELAAIDARIAIAGDNLADLYPLLGVALPETNPYRTDGRIVRQPGSWQYRDFTARIGNSDGSGSLQVDSRPGQRPLMHGRLHFGKLDFADLGPVIGQRIDASRGASDNGAGKSAKATAGRRVLPDRPFRTERWNSVDADIRLSAGSIIRNPRLPINQLATHLQLRDRLLTLSPLEFDVAGGKLAGTVRLDGRREPILAHAQLTARGIVFQRLFPTVKLKTAKVGKVTGKIELTGKGNSVARMLGTASGHVGLVIDGGEVSRLAMEMADLHVLESIALKIGGDQPIRIRCGMADLAADNGVMRFEQFLFDTEITNINGAGSIDFGQESLDLTLTPESKKPSLIAFRSPLFVRGSFARPQVSVDKKRIAIRSLGAVALGVANPVLALAPLIETGPGEDSDCGRLLAEMRQKTR